MKIRSVLSGAGLAAATGITVLLTAPAATAAVPTTMSGPAAGTNASVPGPHWFDNLECSDLAAIHTGVQNWIEIIAGGADVPGSTAWVSAELAQAQAAGNTRRVDRLQKVLDARAAHPEHWEHVLTRIEKVEQRKGC